MANPMCYKSFFSAFFTWGMCHDELIWTLKFGIISPLCFQVNKEDSFKPIVDYIDAQYESYLQEELKIKRSLSR